MKSIDLVTGLIASVLFLPSTVTAQSGNPTSRSPGRGVEARSLPPVTRASLSSVRIGALDLNAVDSGTAIVSLMKQTRVSYDFAPEFYRKGNGVPMPGPQAGTVVFKQSLNLPQRTITLRMENVRLIRALESLTKAIGIRWDAEEDEGNVIIHFLPDPRFLNELPVPERTSQGGLDGGGLGGSFGGGGFVGGSFGGGGFGGSGSVNFSPSDPFLFDRVTCDVKDTPVRAVLKTLFDQHRSDYAGKPISLAVDEDVTPEMKLSIMLSNVRLKSAIDVVCQSAGIGWRTESTPNGVLVRVSKRYGEAEKQ